MSLPNNNTCTVLIVDDEPSLRRVLAKEVSLFGHQVLLAEDGESALALIRQNAVDVCLLDLRLPGISGLELLDKVKGLQPLAEVIILTGHGEVDSAIRAMKQGAYDFLTKPCPLDRIEVLIAKALEKKKLNEQALGLADSTRSGAPIYLGESLRMNDAMAMLKKAARTDVPILITGESGTGKELFAREAHRLSPFATGPFVAINCGALTPTIVESTLFGHEVGAFTGASRRKRGLVEVAEGGSLFLDEAGELPLDIQVKLLRFTQSGEFQRVGGEDTHYVHTRLLAATNVNLEVAVGKGAFRQDLYYRLNTIKIHIPPLRERRDDIEVLARCFLNDLIARGRPKRRFQAEALALLRTARWAGNVRELKSTVDRLAILCDNEEINADDVRRYHRHDGDDEELAEIRPIRELEKRLILKAIGHFNGDKKRAAEALQVSLKTLYNKLKGYQEEP